MYTSKELQERLDERQKYVAIGDVDQGWNLVWICMDALRTIEEYEKKFAAENTPCPTCGAVSSTKG